MTPADLVAEAVVTAFASGYAANPRTISQDIDVQRVHVSQVDNLSKLADFDAGNPAAKAIKVYVVALPEKSEFETRGTRNVVYGVQVALAAKPKSTSVPAHVDALKVVAGQLRDWFVERANKLPGRQEAFEELQNLVEVDFQSLSSSRLFLSEFVLKFTGSRPCPT